MYENFKQVQIQTSDPEVKINLRYGGDGPPVLLIHGNPLTHVHWHLVAPRLATGFYGGGNRPAAGMATAASRAAGTITAITHSAAWRRTRST